MLAEEVYFNNEGFAVAATTTTGTMNRDHKVLSERLYQRLRDVRAAISGRPTSKDSQVQAQINAEALQSQMAGLSEQLAQATALLKTQTYA